MYSNNDADDYGGDSDYNLGWKGRLIGANLYRNFLANNEDARDDIEPVRVVDEAMENYDSPRGGNYIPAIYDYDDDEDREEAGYARNILPFSPDQGGDDRTIILEEDRKKRAQIT